jgi:hypothetical protein
VTKKKRRVRATTGQTNLRNGGVCSVCSHEKSREISLKILERKTSLEDLQKEYGIHRSSLSRHARKHLNHRREKNFEHSRLAVPYTEIFALCPGDTLPANIAVRNDVLVLGVVYAPPLTEWITRPTPQPYPMELISVAEVQDEMDVRQNEARAAGFFVPLVPAVEVVPHDPPEPQPEKEMSPRTTFVPSPAVHDPPLSHWLDYFRVR